MKNLKWVLLLLVILIITGFWGTVIFSTMKSSNNEDTVPINVSLDVTGEDPSEEELYEDFINRYEGNFNELKKLSINGTHAKISVKGEIYSIESLDEKGFKLTIITPEKQTLYLNIDIKYRNEILEYKVGQNLTFLGYLLVEEPMINLGDRKFVGKADPHNLYITKLATKPMTIQEVSMGRRALVLLENRKGVSSGIIINPYGYVVTAYDNVKRYEDRTTGKLYIYINNVEKLTEPYPLTLVTYDEKLNIALMKLPPSQTYPFLAMGEEYTPSNRVVSIKNRKRLRDVVFDVDDSRIGDKMTLNDAEYFYTEDEMHESGKGGMIVDLSGRLIGMSMFRWIDEYADKEMNFAISSKEIMKFIDSYALKNTISVKEYDKDLFSNAYSEEEIKIKAPVQTKEESNEKKPEKETLINSTLDNPYEAEKTDENYKNVYGEFYDPDKKEE